ncbi:hypothetical protein Brsp01_45100 [Brucella sp. NBRC 12950]|nr:hypothetical protein Brsp01_45100 [Brucella sp. NBRC 12950]
MVDDVKHKPCAQDEVTETDDNRCSRGFILPQQDKSGETEATTVCENDWPLMPQEAKNGP